MTIKLQLQKIVTGVLHTGNENKHNHESKTSIKPHEKNRQVLRKKH
jgi:hypothetical protein